MTQPKTHCAGNGCPSKTNCQRFTAPRDQDSVPAALYVRREAGCSACDMYDPVNVMTTFKID